MWTLSPKPGDAGKQYNSLSTTNGQAADLFYPYAQRLPWMVGIHKTIWEYDPHIINSMTWW